MFLSMLRGYVLCGFHYFIVFSFINFVYLYVTFFGFVSVRESSRIDNRYDYIIVGGGSAGAIVASRLSDDKHLRILLIEAGVDKIDLLNIPALGPVHQLTEFDWKYSTVPQEFSCFALDNRSSKWPAGRLLGGTTHLNYMLYVKGHYKDYLSWENPATGEWSYHDTEHYFKKAEKYVHTGAKSDARRPKNKKGSMLLRRIPFKTPFSKAVIKAAFELGHKVNDINKINATGFTMPYLNMNKNGKRWTSDQYLKHSSGKKKNLTIIKNSIVQKILFRNNFEAYGVKYNTGGKIRKVYARQEVILSAGAIGSPKLLMLSGVGPERVLKNANIPLKINLPVGQNLQDHVTTGLDLVTLNQTVFSLSDLASLHSAYDYFINGKGPFTSALCEAVATLHSRLSDPRNDPPDLELMVMMAGLSTDGGIYSRYTIGITDEVWKSYFKPLIHDSIVSILPVLLHPKSVGEVTLDPKDPFGQPIINPRYLQDKKDVKTLIEGIRIIKKLIESDAMKRFGARFNTRKFPGCEEIQFDSDDYWECYVRHLTITSYHPTGTCRMGSSARESVVDHRLKLHKTNRLRVIDASIIPTPPSGNTNAQAVMIAEKGSDLIKEDFYHRFSCCKIREIFIFKPNIC